MNLKQYVGQLNSFLKENPSLAKAKVVTSADSEGNYITPVYYSPSAGVLDGRDFTGEDELEDYDLSNDDINAVCVN